MFRQIRLVATSLIALSIVNPAQADGLAGSYLAARHASIYSDYEEAAKYYTQALARDPSNPSLLENAVTAFVGLGELNNAILIARKMQSDGIDSQIGHMVLIADHIRQDDYASIFADYEAGLTVGPLVDGLVKAWAHVGTGQMSDALAAFDEVAGGRGTRAFGLYHKALALAMVGDYEGADRIFSGEEDGPLRATRNGVIAHAEILSQLERNDAAIQLIDTVFGGDSEPVVRSRRDALVAGETLPFTRVDNANDGMAEVFFSVAGVLSSDAAPSYTLIYSRLAEYLDTNNTDAILLSAQLLEEMERYELATATYDRVPSDDPTYHIAELGRAEALSEAGKTDAAIEVLTRLAENFQSLPIVHSALGDILRSEKRFGEATDAYDKAIELFKEPEPSQWVTYYARGITHEREGNWELSETDFRNALDLSPGQPFVLNYLGYSLVERQENLDEALAMIEEAVARRPDDGFVTDSLGWVLYRMGRYDEAIGHMERAVELTPVDPIVTDHLGDVLWAVGRKREAEFQWTRALSFDPEEKEADRIRRKLEVGLDAVLNEEGAEPLAVANEG